MGVVILAQSGTMRCDAASVVWMVVPRDPSKDADPDTSPDRLILRAVVSLSDW